ESDNEARNCRRVLLPSRIGKPRRRKTDQENSCGEEGDRYRNANPNFPRKGTCSHSRCGFIGANAERQMKLRIRNRHINQVMFPRSAFRGRLLIDVILGDWHFTADTKCATRYLQSRRSLLTFVFVEIDTTLHPAHCCCIKSAR